MNNKHKQDVRIMLANLEKLIEEAREGDLCSEMLLQLFNSIAIKLLKQIPNNVVVINEGFAVKEVIRHMMNACYQQANEFNNLLEESK